MALLETPQTLALDGGWLVLNSTNGWLGGYITPTHRNVSVSTASALAFSIRLPHASDHVGRPILPVGHRVWVHNVSLSQAVTVQSFGASAGWHFASESLAAGRSSEYLLVGYAAGREGEWVRTASSLVNGSGPTVPDGFRMDLTLSAATQNVNLLERAVAEGYDGTVAALILVTIPAGIVVGSGTRFAAAFDTGGDSPVGGISWHASSVVVLLNHGRIQGYGGRGGAGGVGGTGAAAGLSGEDGGPAIRARIPILLTNSGYVLGGCGGGGGGDSQLGSPGVGGGGGGGGCGANVLSPSRVIGGEGNGGGATGATAGETGSTVLGGDGGLGNSIAGVQGGNGGAGGQLTPFTLAPQAGQAGRIVNNSTFSTNGLGGAPGPAISRHASATVTIVAGGGGLIGGTTIVV